MPQIKPIKEQDIENLARIMVESFNAIDSERLWDYAHAFAYLAYWFKKQPDMFYGAFDENNDVIGAMVVNIKPWRTGNRCTDGVVFVDVKYQRKGIAKLLFVKVLEKAVKEYNTESFEAITFAGKEFPLTWYEKIGITPDEHAVFIKGKCSDILNKLSK